jgi:hypothetical protein
MTGPNPSSISTLTRELKNSGGSIFSSSDWSELKLTVLKTKSFKTGPKLKLKYQKQISQIGSQKLVPQNLIWKTGSLIGDLDRDSIIQMWKENKEISRNLIF